MRRMLPRSRTLLVTAASVILAAASVAPQVTASDAAPNAARQAAPVSPGWLSRVHMNEIQTINTHNSYKRETTLAEQQLHDQIRNDPGHYARAVGYSHASLASQFEDQNVRGIEIDLYGDPQGGLYANPLARQRLGLGPQPDPAWRRPGIKVMHIPDIDYNTTCILFAECLRQVKAWSDANPTHVPIFIMLELKRSDSFWVSQGGVVAPPWDEAAMVGVDAEIRSVFDDGELIRPDDVRRPGLTLEQSVLQSGWPSLADSRGKVMFFFNNVGSSSPYSAQAPNLEGRVMFVNAGPGQPNSAYHGRDEVDVLQPVIMDLVDRGYLIRTRSDISLSTVGQPNGLARVQQSLDSGAQVISTDFPTVGMAARYGTDFVARIPGNLPARCNPINAPRQCRDDLLEAKLSGR